jgi:hypothetical protein
MNTKRRLGLQQCRSRRQRNALVQQCRSRRTHHREGERRPQAAARGRRDAGDVDHESSPIRRRKICECSQEEYNGRRLRRRTVNGDRRLIPVYAAPSAVSFPFWSLAVACVSRTEKPTPSPPFRRITSALRL